MIYPKVLLKAEIKNLKTRNLKTVRTVVNSYIRLHKKFYSEFPKNDHFTAKKTDFWNFQIYILLKLKVNHDITIVIFL